MSRQKIYTYLAAILIFTACTKPTADNTAIVIPDLTHWEESQESTQLSALFNDIRLVQLETNDSCLVDDNGKIIRYDSVYYVESNNEVLQFDLNGKFLRKLSRIGSGPGENIQLLDFNIVNRKDSAEIWISSTGGIYIYEPQTLAFKQHIPIKGHVTQFYYINDRTILTVKPEDITFKIYDMEGHLRKEFMEKDLANSMTSIAQFTEYKNLILYQWDNTQEVVVYDPSMDSLYLANLFPPQESILTSKINREYYEKYGFKEQVKKTMATYTTVVTSRCYKNEIMLILSYPDGHRSMVLHKDGKTVSYPFQQKSRIENDLIQTTDLTFLNTVIATTSNQGFLFFIGLERYPKDTPIEEENPLLLDVSGINL